MAATFEYAVLRLVPDATRGESVNIGLVVFLADRLDVRVHPEMAKVRALNPNIDAALLRDLPSSLNTLLSPLLTTEARHSALTNQLPLIHTTRLGWFQCEPSQYEAQVRDLLVQLVFTPHRPYQRTNSRLDATLRAAFRKSNLLGAAPSEVVHRVVPNYPIALNEGLSADFAIKNGRMHFTAALDLRGAEDTVRHQKRGQAALKSMTLIRAKERFKSCVRLGVYITSPQTQEWAEPHLAMLRHDTDALFDFSDRKAKAEYMERIHEAARH